MECGGTVANGWQMPPYQKPVTFKRMIYHDIMNQCPLQYCANTGFTRKVQKVYTTEIPSKALI